MIRVRDTYTESLWVWTGTLKDASFRGTPFDKGTPQEGHAAMQGGGERGGREGETRHKGRDSVAHLLECTHLILQSLPPMFTTTHASRVSLLPCDSLSPAPDTQGETETTMYILLYVNTHEEIMS